MKGKLVTYENGSLSLSCRGEMAYRDYWERDTK